MIVRRMSFKDLLRMAQNTPRSCPRMRFDFVDIYMHDDKRDVITYVGRCTEREYVAEMCLDLANRGYVLAGVDCGRSTLTGTPVAELYICKPGHERVSPSLTPGYQECDAEDGSILYKHCWYFQRRH